MVYWGWLCIRLPLLSVFLNCWQSCPTFENRLSHPFSAIHNIDLLNVGHHWILLTMLHFSLVFSNVPFNWPGNVLHNALWSEFLLWEWLIVKDLEKDILARQIHHLICTHVMQLLLTSYISYPITWWLMGQSQRLKWNFIYALNMGSGDVTSQMAEDLDGWRP